MSGWSAEMQQRTHRDSEVMFALLVDGYWSCGKIITRFMDRRVRCEMQRFVDHFTAFWAVVQGD